MTTDANDNAFPYSIIEQGLTKREYFVAMAMKGLLAGNYSYYDGNSNVPVPSMIAKDAVEIALATIEELNKRSK